MIPYTDYTVRLGDLKRAIVENPYDPNLNIDGYMRYLKYNTPPAQPERLSDDDIETIRIHLSAFKEDLCNQHRWKEAEDYERLISRFISFASAQSERTEQIQEETIEEIARSMAKKDWNRRTENG